MDGKDVLAVLAEYSAQHGDPEDFEQARAAVANALDVLRMSAEALESAAKCVGGGLAIVLGDRAMFARAALAAVRAPAPELAKGESNDD